MSHLLATHELKTWFPVRRGIFSRISGHIKAVDGVNLHVDPGETLGLVGESGCGKSTVARSLLGLDKPTSGSASFEGREITGIRAGQLRELRRNMQIIFQDPYSSLNPRMTVAQIVAEGVVAHGIVQPQDADNAAAAFLAEVGLNPDYRHRFPHEFSGGQRQRISIARAVALRPRLLLCDEPVSALDVSVQAQVINLLLDLKARLALSYLFISHDISVVRFVADRLAVMYLGKIVETGNAEELIDHPIHPYTRALLSAVPACGKQRHKTTTIRGEPPSPLNPPPGCRFAPRCPFALPACSIDEPPLTPPHAHPARLVACIRKDTLAP